MSVIWIIILIIAAFSIFTFNSLIKLRNLVKEAWSGIDVQLKRRYNLIPNLVNLVKGYAQYEKDVLESVTNARAKTTSSTNTRERAESEDRLSETLKTLFAVVENYPQLKANQNYLALQKELSEIEDNIQLSRRYYNGVVRDLNIKIESAPSNIIAALFKFQKADFFQIESAVEREVPKVKP
jgi:LemA protein